MMTQQQFADNIRNWAEARNLLSLDSIAKQGMYLIAEVGEAVGEHLKGNLPAMMLELGDVLVVLQVMRLQLGRECPGDPVPPHGMDTETLLRDSARYAVSASGLSSLLAFYNSTSSEALKQDERAKLVAVLGRLQEYICRAIQAIGFAPDQARQAVWDKIANRKGKTVDGVFIKD